MSGIAQALFARTAAASGWSFVAIGSVGTGTTPAVGIPAGLAAGQLLVIFAAATSGTFVDPAGWTIGTNSANRARLSYWYKIATGSETTVNLSGIGTSGIAVMLSYSGINATPLDTAGTLASTLVTTSLTTTTANSLVISMYGHSTVAGVWTGTPASTTVRYDSAGLAGAAGLLVVDELKATAGATTSRTATSGGSNPQSNAVSFKI